MPLTIIDPVGQSNAASNQGTFDHDKYTTLMGLGRFGLPRWNCTGVYAVPNASHPSTNNEMRERVRSALQNSANRHDGAAQHDGLPSAQWIADEDGQDGTTEASQIIGRNRNASFRPGTFHIGVDLWEVLGKRREIEYTTSDTLIITE